MKKNTNSHTQLQTPLKIMAPTTRQAKTASPNENHPKKIKKSKKKNKKTMNLEECRIEFTRNKSFIANLRVHAKERAEIIQCQENKLTALKTKVGDLESKSKIVIRMRGRMQRRKETYKANKKVLEELNTKLEVVKSNETKKGEMILQAQRIRRMILFLAKKTREINPLAIETSKRQIETIKKDLLCSENEKNSLTTVITELENKVSKKSNDLLESKNQVTTMTSKFHNLHTEFIKWTNKTRAGAELIREKRLEIGNFNSNGWVDRNLVNGNCSCYFH